MTFDDAVQMLAANLEDLFGEVPQRAHMAAAYFPSELRNPILQAGSEKRMLRLTYSCFSLQFFGSALQDRVQIVSGQVHKTITSPGYSRRLTSFSHFSLLSLQTRST
jgi:hypothetical protein